MQYPTRWSMVLHFLRGSKRWFAAAIFSACVVSLLDLANPKIIGFTVDSVIDTGSTSIPSWLSAFVKAAGGIEGIRSHLWLIAVLVAGVAAVRAVFRYFFEFFNTKGAEKLVKTMRDDLFGHILHLPYAWHSENATGDIIQRCTSDVDTVKTFLSDQLSALLRTLILMGLSLFFMFRIHVRLAAAAAVFIPVIVLYSLFFHSRIGSAFEKADEEEGKAPPLRGTEPDLHRILGSSDEGAVHVLDERGPGFISPDAGYPGLRFISGCVRPHHGRGADCIHFLQ